MADYVLSAKGTYDGSDFDSGIENSRSKLSGFMEQARAVGKKVRTAMGDAVVKTADTITSSIGGIGAGVAAIAATGGISRALRMEQAKTMFKGLKLEWSDYEATISGAVDGTAFSMDAAALTAANLAASGVAAGEQMERALNGATGVAATFGADLADIGGIYQKVAAQGKLSGEQLAQLSDRGINGLSILSEYLGKSGEDVRKMVTDGKVDFKTFSDAMYETFGDSAKGANDTFAGVTANIRSNIAKIGEIFATPALGGLQRVFAALLPVIKSVRTMLTPLSESFAEWVEGVVPKAVEWLDNLKETIDGFGGDLSKIPSWVKVAAAAIGVLSVGAMGGLVSQIPVIGGALGGLFGTLGKLSTPVGTVVGAFGKLEGVLGGFGTSAGTVGGLLSGLGGIVSKLLSPITGLIGLVGRLGGGFVGLVGKIPLVGSAFDVIGGALGSVGGAITGTVGKIGTAIGGIVSKIPVLNKLGGAFSGLVSKLGGVGKAITAVQIPMGAIVAVAVALAAAFADLMVTNEGFRSTILGLVGDIGASLAPALQSVMDLLPTLGNAFGTVKHLVSMLAPALLGVVAAVAPLVSTIIGAAVPAIAFLIDEFFEFVAAIVNFVTPAIEAVASFTSSVMPQIQGIIESAMAAIQAVVLAVLPHVQDIFYNALDAMRAIAKTVWPVIKSIVTSAMSVIQAVIDTVMAAINGDWQGVWEGIKAFGLAVWNGIKSIVSTAITAVQQNIGNVLSAIKALWDAVWGAISSFLSAIWGGIKAVVSGAVSAMSSVIGSGLSAIQGAWNSAWSAIRNLAASVWSGLTGIVGAGVGAVRGFVSGLVSSVTGFFSNMWSSVTSTVSNMWSNATSAFASGVSSVIGAVSGLPGQIMGLFANAGSWLIDSGRSIINGLVSGIQSAIGGAVSAVSGAIGQLRSLFPFSPAKEGPFSGKGWVLYSGISIMDALGEGAEKRRRKTVNAYKDIAGQLRDSLELGDVKYDYATGVGEIGLSAVTYGNVATNDVGYGVEDALSGLYGEVAELRSTLGRTIADNAPVVVESEREANRRYRRAAYA